ncbi:hypothetical protein M752DRAFT_119999 [Aspergillus phoenicis ATCC 13157]|uniref:Uncharacterized protein n=1 Tax=Aspergillus phoenicis ATCC 13157 TaxID=1353007 RepID=A0A370PTI5_ASPPH|nr:hypothetical protein M752DRAFT_119999 [Aspergillus phoenicis ATCC 13157]
MSCRKCVPSCSNIQPFCMHLLSVWHDTRACVVLSMRSVYWSDSFNIRRLNLPEVHPHMLC